MSLININDYPLFNVDEIKPGYAMWAKHRSWSEGLAGYVQTVSPTEVAVSYHPGISHIMNHYIITSKEAANGEWHIRYSPDLETIKEYGGNV